ncbi:DUF1489 family protein [Alphaproteobacteria bacterium]|jgi:hypothetical protein|nr:DUF1489 family protein [Alphaproteobacteria bacterium]
MVNLVKLCVGITAVGQLEQLQATRRRESSENGRLPVNIHITRNKPKRSQEIIDHGSLYWVIRRQIRVRQRIIRVDDLENLEGKKRCGLILDPQLIRTEHRAYRPFQGWRYLEQSDAPLDLTSNQEAGVGMPSEMEEELRELGLL